VSGKDDLSAIVVKGIEDSLIGSVRHPQCREGGGACFGALSLAIEQSRKAGEVIEAVVSVSDSHPLQRTATDLHAGHTVVDVAPPQCLVKLLEALKIHHLSRVVPVGLRGLEDVGEGILHPGCHAVVGPVGHDTWHPAKGHQRFGESGKTLGVAKEVPCPDDHVGT